MLTTIILVLTLICSVIILIAALQNKKNPAYLSLILFSSAMAFASIALFCLNHNSPFSKSTWMAILILGERLGYTSILTFTIQYSQHQKWLKPKNILLLGIEPITTQILYWTNPGGIFFSAQSYSGEITIPIFHDPWILVISFYTNILILISIFLLISNFNYRALAYRQQSKFILAGLALSQFANNSFAASNLLPLQEIQIISLFTTGAALIVGFLRAGVFEINPIARESVVEHMNDGWIVLDSLNRVIDVNIAAERIIGIPAKNLSGQAAEKIFIDWPNLMNSINDTRELDLKGSVKIDGEWTYLNIHISPFIDSSSNSLGKLIVWRDITERRIADEARQQARDEMFILLHSITSAASRALNLDDFLGESIYQIVYSSHSQSIAVYLLEERDTTSKEKSLILAANHGNPLITEELLSSKPGMMDFFISVIEKGGALMVPNTHLDLRVPTSLRDLEPMTLLLIPMIFEDQKLGLICLTRIENSPYSPDEIARLIAVVDEVATFIQSNRQRQLSIALAERQRLVRDLHDSVTQKLYGLVTLAEATQAGIQAGVLDMPAKVIVKMAENARQALKEMRLFMFQMQPVDFAREGLAAAIQHRLSAVEGRADINARLISDDNISLPMEKELALYFITQEALNNVIKHARAKKVSVSLKKNKTNFILQVEDDGCGFNLKTTDTGGIGMRSMRERAVQIGGELKVSSTPEKGTKITVTLRNNGKPGSKE